MKLQLPDVSLVILDTAYHDIARIVANDCIRQIDFGSSIVVSDIDLGVENSRFIDCGKLDRTEILRFRWQKLHLFLKTSHALIVEWDAGIIDPSLWTDEFLNYDYCGAPWEGVGWKGGVVGNGGFSLRSHKLLNAVSNIEMSDAEWGGEDLVLCFGHYREKLEAEGYRWAGIELARQFALSDVEDSNKTDYRLYHPEDFKSFGFHGLFNWPRVYNRNKVDEMEQLLTPSAKYKVEYARYFNVKNR